MDEAKKIEARLAELGSTSDEIAAKLRMEGIKGKPEEPDSCVIAKWLNVNDDGYSVYSSIFPSVHHYVWTEEGQVHHLPPVIGEFIASFDRGDYPSLIEN